MPKFSYKAKKGLDEIVEGVIEASSKEDALSKLFSNDLHPIIIEPIIQKQSIGLNIKGWRLFFSRKVTSRQVLIFTQKLAILIRAKIDLMASLRIVCEQTDNPFFRDKITDIYNRVREGDSFSEGLSRFPRIFFPLYINLVKAGEAAGTLDSSLEQIRVFLAKEQAVRTKIAVALAYPSLLLFVGAASIFVLISFVVPRLKPIFSNLGENLPAITKFVLGLSEIPIRNWVIFVAAAAGIFLILSNTKAGGLWLRKLVWKVKLSVPIVKDMVKNRQLIYFSQSLSLLLKKGVPALKSLEIITPAIENLALRKKLEKVYDQISKGRSLSQSMEGITELPDFFIKMIAVGEESGRLAEVLEDISRSYTEQLDSNIAVFNSLIEPLLILFLGIILGGIVLAILIPTFQITQMVN